MLKKLLCLAALLLCLAAPAFAAPLDEIQQLTIDATPFSDGTVELSYRLAWKVLDDEEDGPLSWVQIGVPNPYYEILNVSGDAESYSSYNVSDQAKVWINLNREFHAGETATFGFTIRQYNLFELADDGYKVDFVPGWFDEIDVLDLEVNWLGDLVTGSNADGPEALQWRGPLRRGERFQTVTTHYGDNILIAPVPEEIRAAAEPASSYPEPDGLVILGRFLLIPLAIIGLLSGGYRGGRGFSGGGGGGGGGGCACACAGCACACACAGGGRAGCAKKDFSSFKPPASA